MKKLLVGCILAVAFSSCVTQQSLYSWYDYSNTTYLYNKKRTDELKGKVLQEYQKVIEKQKGTRETVPPGMFAEYGYMLVMSGKKEEGLSFLRQEVKLYPESETYISRIIKQLEP